MVLGVGVALNARGLTDYNAAFLQGKLEFYLYNPNSGGTISNGPGWGSSIYQGCLSFGITGQRAIQIAVNANDGSFKKRHGTPSGSTVYWAEWTDL